MTDPLVDIELWIESRTEPYAADFRNFRDQTLRPYVEKVKELRLAVANFGCGDPLTEEEERHHGSIQKVLRAALDRFDEDV